MPSRPTSPRHPPWRTRVTRPTWAAGCGRNRRAADPNQGLPNPMTQRSYGFTLIEMLVTLAVMALLLMVGLPSMNTWMQNTQLRSSAEGIQGGLQLARAEALRRNVQVRFQFVDTFTAACVLKDNAANWIISMNDPTGKCDAAESDPSAPIVDP